MLFRSVTDYEPGPYYVSVNSATEAFVTVSHGTIGIAIEEAVDTLVVDDGTGETRPESDPSEEEIEDGLQTKESGEEESPAE